MEIGARCAELAGFLENDASSVNAAMRELYLQYQLLTNMVQYYRQKAYIFGME